MNSLFFLRKIYWDKYFELNEKKNRMPQPDSNLLNILNITLREKILMIIKIHYYFRAR